MVIVGRLEAQILAKGNGREDASRIATGKEVTGAMETIMTLGVRPA